MILNLGRPIAIGNTAEIYLRDGNIVKVYLRESSEAIAREAENQAYARSLGLPVPEVIEVTEVNGKPAMVMEHVPGESMGDILLRDPQQMRTILDRSVEVQRTMHTIDAPELRPMREKLAQQIRAARRLTDDQKSQLQSKLDAIGDETKLCHGDFHVQNLIANGDRVMIIDWMDATRGDVRLDVCRSYVLYTGVNAEAAEFYLDEYYRQSGLDRAEMLRWVPVIAGARLSEGIDAGEEERLVQIVQYSC